MRERCAREGWDVVADYVAPGESAYTARLEKRRVMAQLIADAEAGQFDVVLIHESSRLARNSLLDRQIRDRLDACRVELVDLANPTSRKTAMGKFMIGFQANANEYWSDMISEDTQKAYDERFERGLHTGHAPFGYTRGPSTNHPLVVVPDEAAAVRRAFTDYAAGKGFTEIMHEWNALGFRPRSHLPRTQFNITGIQKILGNDYYAGFVRHKGARHEGAHEAIITEDLYQRAHARVQRRVKTSRGGGGLLTGVLRCAACEGPVWTTSASNGRFQYYREAAASQNRECPAAGSLWRVGEVDSEIDAIVRALSLDRDWLDHVDREAPRPPKDASTSSRDDLQAEKKRITNAYMAGAVAEDEWRKRLADVERRLASLPVTRSGIVAVRQRLESFAELWEDAPMAVKRETCRIIFEAARADMTEHSILLKPWEEFQTLFALRRTYVRLGPPRG